MKTRFELVDRLHVPTYKVDNWENGRSFPDAAELLAILGLCPPEVIQQFVLDIAKQGEQYLSPQVPPEAANLIDKSPATPEGFNEKLVGRHAERKVRRGKQV